MSTLDLFGFAKVQGDFGIESRTGQVKLASRAGLRLTDNGVRILTEQAQLFRDKITSNSVSVIDFGGQVAAMAVMPNSRTP